MPRPGGEAGKLGVRYEGIWTVGQILAVLSRSTESIVVEPLQEGEGIEFALRQLDGSDQYHSVKRQRATGEWSLAALCQRSPAGRSILGDLFDKLRAQPSATCSFVSSTGANQLLELTERARRRPNAAEFQEDLEGSDTLAEAYEKYVLPLAPNWETAFDWLQRTTAVLIDEATLTRHIDLRISELLYRPDCGEFVASNVRLQLADHILDCLGTRLAAEALWGFVQSLGYAWSDWANNQPLLASLAAANAQYIRNVELELINSRRVSRLEVAATAATLTAPDGPRLLLLEAAAGIVETRQEAALSHNVPHSFVDMGFDRTTPGAFIALRHIGGFASAYRTESSQSLSRAAYDSSKYTRKTRILVAKSTISFQPTDRPSGYLYRHCSLAFILYITPISPGASENSSSLPSRSTISWTLSLPR